MEHFVPERKIFSQATDEVPCALSNLGIGEMPDDHSLTVIEKFVSLLFQPNTAISDVEPLRWWLFKTKQAQSEKLPPTKDDLRQAILMSHFQMVVWNNNRVPNLIIPSPGNYGWKIEGDHWVPVMTTKLPAPDAVIHLVKCGCMKIDCATGRCSCRVAGLSCTKLCSCSDSDQDCVNCELLSQAHEDDEDENVQDEGQDDVLDDLDIDEELNV